MAGLALAGLLLAAPCTFVSTAQEDVHAGTVRKDTVAEAGNSYFSFYYDQNVHHLESSDEYAVWLTSISRSDEGDPEEQIVVRDTRVEQLLLDMKEMVRHAEEYGYTKIRRLISAHDMLEAWQIDKPRRDDMYMVTEYIVIYKDIYGNERGLEIIIRQLYENRGVDETGSETVLRTLHLKKFRELEEIF